MILLNGIQNFLLFINDNWTTIIVIIGLILSLYKRIKTYISKSDDEKIEIAKQQIKQTILRMVTEAEIDYEEWPKTGSIKRSQVIEEIFTQYPVLSKVTDQASLIEWIDEEIDMALDTLREIIKNS